MIAGCYWSEKKYQALWSDCLRVVADVGDNHSGKEGWIALKLYPALLLLYSGGIAAYVANKFHTLSALTRENIYSNDVTHELPAITFICGHYIFENTSQHLPKGNSYIAVSQHLCSVLRQPLRTILPTERQYEKVFDGFEYLMALVYADESERKSPYNKGTFAAPSALFSFRDHSRNMLHNVEHPIIGQELPAKTIEALLEAGFFNQSIERYQAVKSNTDAFLLKNARARKLW